MNRNPPIYQLTDIQHFYGDKQVLGIKSFDICQGSITGLIGPNGSGKTTFLKLLAFAQKPSHGSIRYKGRAEKPFSPTIRSKVTLLTQKPYLLKRTVFENITYGLKIRKDTCNIKQRVSTVLSSVGLDFDRFSQRMWHELSGGEAQRVAMAARLILKPEILLLDEPIASVDTESAKLIREASLNARDRWGTTLVIASHDLSWLFSVSDHQVSIRNGKLFSTGIENIITGPFEPKDGHMVIKRLDREQNLRLKAPEPGRSTAVIKKEKTYINGNFKTDRPGMNHVGGRIISMHLETRQNLIMVNIRIGTLSFDLSLSPDQISKENLYPGKEVTIRFHPDDVEWI